MLCLLTLTNPDVALRDEPCCAQQLSGTVLAVVYCVELGRDHSEECNLNEGRLCILSGCFCLESKASGNKARHRMEKNFSEGCIDYAAGRSSTSENSQNRANGKPLSCLTLWSWSQGINPRAGNASSKLWPQLDIMIWTMQIGRFNLR